MRNSGSTSLLNEVSYFCEKYTIVVIDMDYMFMVRGRRRSNALEISNLHHYRVEVFYTVLDMQFRELNARFNVASTKLLLYIACLSPYNFFRSFDKK